MSDFRSREFLLLVQNGPVRCITAAGLHADKRTAIVGEHITAMFKFLREACACLSPCVLAIVEDQFVHRCTSRAAVLGIYISVVYKYNPPLCLSRRGRLSMRSPAQVGRPGRVV